MEGVWDYLDTLETFESDSWMLRTGGPKHDGKYSACTESRGKTVWHQYKISESFHARAKLNAEKQWIYCQYAQQHALLPARRYASTGRLIAIATCLSVRLSVTRRYCVKTKKASVMISSPPGSPMILVFWCQISSQTSKGFHPNRGLKEGWGKKIPRFSSFKRQYLENDSRYGQSYY